MASAPPSVVSSVAQPPAVSIIITALNATLYLREAVQSVLAQTVSVSWELLLVEDGSTDATLALAHELALLHPSIRLLQHPGGRNRGISASRNLALSHARAPIIAFLDADDVWLPHHLSSQLPHLAARPEIAMVYAQAERWHDFNLPYTSSSGSLGTNFTPPLLPPGQPSGFIPPPSLLGWFLQDESLTPCTCTVLVRTSIARSLGGFVNHFTGLYDDQVFYSKLALAHPIFVSTEVVARYRQHPASCCAKARRDNSGRGGRARFLAWLRTYRQNLPTFAPVPITLEAQLASSR